MRFLRTPSTFIPSLPSPFLPTLPRPTTIRTPTRRPLPHSFSRHSRSSLHPPIQARTTNTADLEQAVLNSISVLQEKVGQDKVHKYRKSLPEPFAEATATISTLERSSGGFGSARLRQQLVGVWRLVLTDSEAVEKNGGSITGLGNLPGARCTWVEVVLEADGRARTVEGIEVFAGVMQGKNELVGRWQVGGKGGRVLEVTYASAILMGKTKVRADSKAVLETTYCGEKLRVGRSGRGDVYVFVRKE